MRKYRNRKVARDGLSFDSQREADRWAELILLERAGEITDLRRQVPFVLAQAVRLGKRVKPALRYVADAVYTTADGRVVVEDAKGVRTAVYRIKQHLMATVHGIEIVEV
jgi:branched-subunit amino acid transport protein